MGMKKILGCLFGLVCALCVMPVFADDGGPISAVTVAGLVEQNGTPTPNAPIDIVSNNGVLKYSKNLLDMAPENIVVGKYIDNSGAIMDNTANFYNSKFIPVSPSSIYSWSTSESVKYISFMEYDSDQVFLQRTLIGSSETPAGTSGNLTTRSDTAFVLIGSNMYTTDVTLDKIAAVDWQFEKGSSATAYRPYGEIYTDGTVETIADSANHTATVATLLGVGDYRDTQNINTGAITRNVGIKVLDGTEDWIKSGTYIGSFYTNSLSPDKPKQENNPNVLCSHGFKVNNLPEYSAAQIGACYWYSPGTLNYKYDDGTATVAQFKQWLADQYAAGTPVIIVYPLATPTTESVAGQTMTMAPVSNKTGGVTGMTITTLLTSGATLITSIADAIKIASTKYVETEFAPVNAALANAVATVNTVVTQTVAQAAAIAELQNTKQTRPADDPTDANNTENCPAGKKCLLVEDEQGTPHWYEIVESYSRLPDGYTELAYIESTGTQYIDTGYKPTTDLSKIEFKFNVSTDNATIFGVSNSSESRVQMWHYLDRYSSRTFTNTSNNISSVALSLNIDITGNLDATNGKLTINGNSGISTDSDYKTNYSYPMYVFAMNNAGAASTTIASGKVYYLKIYENNTLVRDFVPAKRGDVVGMYDLADPNPATAFHTNQGTGEFTAGPAAQ